ncbi:tyrosine--tRNA ligase [candidate division WWE3 bacterium CG08_land_8_20_14_0_20_43_13]|uniref:Tyrosyl-tRNA synthetase n=1 Tax=candidate division WWE3 bacterium CG08_land_8_20_14_0_20_43_13 TaxID=1975087 RepID=A0A2H0X6Z4_UNCKA|nr:MAG: tyrosine--tRNA ligase [candidate division WWE3 bacterium CG08_land_8_20_14_0_20_43_13]
MQPRQRFELIAKQTEEILTKEDLNELLNSEQPLNHYIGFEISGQLHIGSGLMSLYKIKDFQQAGVNCKIFLADWHTVLNNKLGGDPAKIKKLAISYFKEALIASALCAGADPQKIEFILGSDLYHNNDAYWQSLIDISKNLTLSRVVKSSTIMGKLQGGDQAFARLMYPPMQVNDIFNLNINLAHAGMDQRKAHVIAREVATQLKIKPLLNPQNHPIKPVCAHHPLILGLTKPPVWPVKKEDLRETLSAMKMSKSNPASCVFITDSPDEIRSKIQQAFCPPREVSYNPILNWVQHLLYRGSEDRELVIKREVQHGGSLIVNTYQELEDIYARGDLHPNDLKPAVAQAIIDLLEPARKYFEAEERKWALEEMKKVA